MAGINIIRRWVMSQMTKKSDDGIMITLPDMKKVEINTNITIEKFLQNGINPNAFTNTQQVDNVVNQLNKPKVISQDNPLFKGVMSRMMGKNVIKKDFGPGFKKEIEKMKGKVDDDLPPPGSRGGKDDIAAPVQSAEETLKDMIEAEATNPRFLDYTIDSMLKMEPIDAMKEANKVIKREGPYKNLSNKEAKKILDDTEDHIFERNFKTPDDPDFDPESMADGGRIGYKKGSVDLARRGFMKAAAGVGAGIGALKMGALKLFGKEGTRQVTKQIIKTDNVPGKPEWFDALVTKVINQGEDVTKRFATQERQTVHKLEIDSFKDSKGNKVSVEEVRVTQDADTGEIRVEYLTPDSPGESQVDLVYKKPKPDESDPNPSAEFYAVESEPRVVNFDGDIEFDGENLVDNVDDLMTDTTKLKEIATGKKKTLGEFVKTKNKKCEAETGQRAQLTQAEYLETKYGPGPDPSDYEDFARGGIAGMLGE